MGIEADVIGARELLAVYCADERLDYLCLKRRGIRGWTPAAALDGLPPYQSFPSGGLRALEELLGRIPPKKRRHLHIGVPRRHVFLRDMLLPPMSLEEALEAARAALPVSCHLPGQDIFVDVRLNRLRDKTVQAMVAYTPKKTVEGLLSVVEATGHGPSLRSLLPACLGWAAWLRVACRLRLGAVLCAEGQSATWIALDGTGRVHVVPGAGGEEGEDGQGLVPLILGNLGIEPEHMFSADDPFCRQAPFENTLMSAWPAPHENPASLAAAAAVSGFMDFCLDGREPRVRIVHPAKIAVPWMLALALTAWGLDAENQAKIEKFQRKIQRVTVETRDLEQQLEPLKKNVEEMKRAQTLLVGAAGFMDQRPKFYGFFNDLAERAPEGTWVTNVNYGDGQFVLQMVSPESLKTMEALRASPFVKEAQLRGAVTRRQDGKEAFQVLVELKK